MPKRSGRQRTSNRSSRRQDPANKRKNRPGGYWSNSVGTRYLGNRYIVNPTIGEGKSLRKETGNTYEAAASLACALNAFSERTNQPRFPDGKASESVGMRHQMIHEIEIAPQGTLDIVFYPGINVCATVQNGTTKTLGARRHVFNLTRSKIQRLTNHLAGDVSFNITTAGDANTREIAGLRLQQQEERHIAKWRAVSYGMVLSLVNNSDDNDGWWEACRVTPSNEMRDYGISLLKSGTDVTDAGGYSTPIHQPHSFFKKVPILDSTQMLNQPSYSTGKLRNIHTYMFQLNPEYDDRDFVDLAKCTEIVGVRIPDANLNDATSGPTANVVDLPNLSEIISNEGYPLDLRSWGGTTTAGFPSGEIMDPVAGGNPVSRAHHAYEFSAEGCSNRLQDEIASQYLDLCFDAIYIRIHGVNFDPNNNNINPSKLTMHTVMNQELVYDEKALNAKFHQGAIFHDKHNLVKGSVKAAQPNKSTHNF